MTPLTILVADDNDNVRYVCERTLESKGHQVITVTNGRDAIEEGRKRHIDLLVTDLVMPGCSGTETFQTLRTTHPDLLGIIITGRGTMNDAINAIRLGFSAFIAKPFSPSELVVAVEDAVEKHRLEVENTRLRALLELYEIGKAATSTLDLPELLNRILEGALRETRADRGSIMLHDPETDELRVGAAVGLPPEVIASASRRLGEGVSGWIAKHRQPLILDGGSPKVPAEVAGLLQNANLNAALCLPLVSKGNLVGVLNLSSTDASVRFREGDLELLQILASQAATAIENSRLHTDLQNSYLSTIHALAQAIDAKDPYTRGHSANVAQIAVRLARALGLSAEEQDALHVAGILHDVGKIGIPDRILLKPGRLDKDEYSVIQQHPDHGVKILSPAKIPYAEVLEVVHYHHERVDGTGYPRGLRGEGICLSAKIMAVADCFDAMTSDRAYRKGMPVNRALSLMSEVAGSQLAPELVELLVQVVGSPDAED